MAQKIKRHFLRTFGFAVMLLMVISSAVPGMISKIQVAHAAAGAGTATINVGTGGTSASDAVYGGAAATGAVTVGTKSYVKIDLTVGAGGILADQKNVTVQINTNLFPANTWGTGKSAALTDLTTVGTWFVSYTDNGGATDNTSVPITFTASTAVNTGLISVQANQQMDALDVIHIYGVVQDDNNILAMADVVVKTDDTGADDLTQIGTGVSPRIATTAADAAATVAKATATSGSTGNLTLAFTVPRTLIATDKINITFPDSYTVANTTGTIAAGVITCSSGGGDLTVTTSSQTLILTVGVGTMTAGACTVTIPGADAIPQYFDATDLSAFTVQTTGSVNIATDTSLTDSLTNTLAADANITIAKASPTPGSAGALTLTLNVPRTLVATDKINITFPTFYLVAATTTAIASTDVSCSAAGGNTLTVSYPGANVLTLTVAGAKSMTSDPTCTVIIPGLDAIPQYVASTDITTFTVQTAASVNIATDTSLSNSLTDTITPGSLTGTSVVPASLMLLTKGTATVSFTTTGSETILNSDKIKVTFPAGYDVSGVGATDGACSTMAGTFTTAVSGQVVTITRAGDGGIPTVAGAQTCTIANVWTPNAKGDTGVYYIDVVSTGGFEKYQDLTVAVSTLVGGSQSSGGGGGGVVADTTPPTNTSVAIVGAPKVPTATVQLTLAATGATEMLISNVADFGGASWETYNTVKNWTLISGNGARSVYVEFRDAAHNVSAVVQANVTVEANAPAPAVVPVPVVPAVQQPTAGVPFLDVAAHWAKDYIVKLFQMGVVQGCTPTSYCPDVFLTRAEMVKIALLTNGYKIGANVQSFSDVDGTMWFAPYIALAKDQGIVGGYPDGTFHPNASITRAEALKILLIAAKKNVTGAVAATFVDVDQMEWYAKYVNYGFDNKVVTGKDVSHFAPADNITRAEMAKIAILTFELK